MYKVISFSENSPAALADAINNWLKYHSRVKIINISYAVNTDKMFADRALVLYNE